MARPHATLALGLSLCALAGCGRKGPLAVPAGREPVAAESLRAVQRGGTVVLEWDNPVKAVSGRPLAGVETVEVWVYERILPAVGRPPALADVEKQARLAARIAREEFGRYRRAGDGDGGMGFAFAFDPGPSGPKKLAFSVRFLDGKGRSSDFTAPAAVDVRACPRPPGAVSAAVFPDFIEVRWTAPEANIDGSRPAALGGYNVYRTEGGGGPRRLTPSILGDPRFEDRDFDFGAAYAYTVRAVADGTQGAVESAGSETIEILARDVFPPAPPAGLAVLAGEGVVSLSWRPAKERDLDGYRVWRRDADGAAFVALGAGLVRETAYTDRTAAAGASYVYAVSAVDLSANESPRSESAPVAVRGGRS